MTDVLFGPTIIVFCAMHYFRISLAQSGWFKGVEGRVTTVVYSQDVDKLQLLDFVSSGIALRLNGNVRELFLAKIVLMVVNMLPLLLAKPLPVLEQHKLRSPMIEKSMAISHHNVGGLCSSMRRGEDWICAGKIPRVEPSTRIINGPGAPILSSYELIRLGYVVYGGKFVMKFDDWDIISTSSPCRSFFHLWNHRVIAWTLETAAKSGSGKLQTRRLQFPEPEMMRLDDPRLFQVPWWHISACDIE